MRYILSEQKKPLSLALLSGLLLALSCAGPISFGPAAWIALIPLLQACASTTVRQAAFAGFVCGLVYFLLMLYWVVIVMTTYGHLEWWLSLPALLLLASYMALYPAFFSGLTSWTMRFVSPLWTVPVVWVALDFLRGFLFTGFPWQDLAYTQYKYPLLIQAADLTGHFGITFLIVLCNSAAFVLIRHFSQTPQKKPSRPLTINLALALTILASALIYGLIRFNFMEKRMAEMENISITVIQGNISQDQKWVPGKLKKTIDTYLSLSEKALGSRDTSLLIWPETALPLYPMESNVFPYIMDTLNKRKRVNLLTGAPHRSNSLTGPAEYFNSAFLLNHRKDGLNGSDSNHVVGRYDKQHLVPFGEYIPLSDYLPLPGPLVQTIGDFSPGTSQVPLPQGNAKIGLLICYESIFPELTRKQVERGANMLVNITNDAWFGRSSAPWQHLSMAVLRSIETRKSLARAANTGISGFIDPLGRLNQLSPLFEEDYKTMDVPLLEEITFYTAYGHYFAPLCMFLSGCLIFFAWRKKKT